MYFCVWNYVHACSIFRIITYLEANLFKFNFGCVCSLFQIKITEISEVRIILSRNFFDSFLQLPGIIKKDIIIELLIFWNPKLLISEVCGKFIYNVIKFVSIFYSYNAIFIIDFCLVINSKRFALQNIYKFFRTLAFSGSFREADVQKKCL